MNTALVSVVAMIMIVGLTIFQLSMKARRSLPLMVGMMVAMASGMLIGLTVGVIGGILYKGDLFLSTLLGSGAGMLIGGLIGFSFGILGVLDGVLSGLMGGMMGAMLGEMIDANYHEVTTRGFFILSLMVLFVIIHILIGNIENRIKILNYSNNPLFLTIVLSGMIFLSIQQGPIWEESNMESRHHSHSEEITEDVKEKVIELEATEFSYSPDLLTINKGEKITLILNNTGEVEHDIEFDADNVKIYSTSNSHTDENSDFVHLHVKPNEKNQIEFTILEEGTFTFICTLPGHEQAGMKGKIKVT
jgi:uncharacterized cupredoxin-like copper-binding protein